MKKVLKLTYASSLTDIKEINSSFDSGVLRVCYTGDNRNKTSLSHEAIQDAAASAYNCPIVCSYDRESDSIGSHDIELVKDDSGVAKIVNLTQPIGVIPESAKMWFEDYEELDGTVHEYFYVEALLWKRQEAYQKIKADGIENQSMEITVLDGKNENGIYNINKFEFTAFCLLGDGVEPCFESASLELYSVGGFKAQLSEMMEELKLTYTVGNPTISCENKNSQDSTKGGNKTSMNEKAELAKKYGIDISTLDFSIDNMSIEELETKFQSITATEPSGTPSAGSDENNELSQNFELDSNIEWEIRNEVNKNIVHKEWGEYYRYYFKDFDVDAQEVYCEDSESGLLYGFNYSVDGDKVTIDWESRKRKKYEIVDFEGEDEDSEFRSVFEMMEKKLDEGVEVAQKYEKTTRELDSLNKEVAELRQYKADNEKNLAEAKCEEIFARFENLKGIEEFDALCENHENYSLEALEDKCWAILGKNSSMQFALNNNKTTQKKAVDRTIDDDSDEPYGGLFVQYAHNHN